MSSNGSSNIRPKVYVLYTGGTIGSVGSPLAPAKVNEFAELMASQPGFSKNGDDATSLSLGVNQDDHKDLTIDITIDAMEPAIDSSSMTPNEWILIAQRVLQNYAGYLGFVVLHGTDTMAFTASALSFLLGRGLSKPVIVTGSQVPLSKARNDALRNVQTSITSAATQMVPEVQLFFDNKLLRGNRSVKASASDFPAFNSPNLAPLGRVGIEFTMNSNLLLSAPSHEESLEHSTNMETLVKQLVDMKDAFATFSVISIILYPGVQASTIQAMLAQTTPPVKGVVMQAFGAGNAPANDELILALKNAHDDGVVLVDVTQILMGTVDLDAYESASGLKHAGAISGYDMTPEAALAKLVCLIGRGYKQDEIEKRLTGSELGDLSTDVREASDKRWATIFKHRGHGALVRRLLHKKRKADDM